MQFRVVAKMIINMTTKFHIFNPEHDSALALESGIYTPKPQIQQFAKDLRTLPLWYSDEEDKVILHEISDQEWLNSVGNIIPNIKDKIASTEEYKHFQAPKRLMPWGIDSTVCRLTNTTQIDGENTDDVIKRTKILSSREQTQDALTRLKEKGLFDGFVSQKIDTVDKLRNIHKEFGKIVVKAPWSSSGRGVLFIDEFDEKEAKRIGKIIENQGFVMAESFFEKEIDFAIEFEDIDGQWQFAGYSLFSTDEHGAYKQNLLASDEILKHEICRHADADRLNKIVEFYCQYFQGKSSDLRGNKIIGVDMMAGNGRIHPCVEINVRHTMGIVARRLYDKYIEPGKTGYYAIIRQNTTDDLRKWNAEQTQAFPSTISNGKISKGFVALTPIEAKSVFEAYVVVE